MFENMRLKFKRNYLLKGVVNLNKKYICLIHKKIKL